jgi:phosphohistidine phosphatase
VKTVILFRHGKSDWDASYESDHDRPLAKRGRKAADLMGVFLSEKGEVPDLAISSTARRARDTLDRAVEAGGWECRLELLEELYLPNPYLLIDVIQRQDEAVSSVMLVGHQPAWSEALSLLVGGGEFHFPTAAMARIDVDIERWDEVEPGAGELRWLVTPKQVAGA